VDNFASEVFCHVAIMACDAASKATLQSYPQPLKNFLEEDFPVDNRWITQG
jgi:hypothetical protein